MIAIHAAEPATAVDRAIAWKCGNLGKRVYAQPTPMCIKRSKAIWIAASSAGYRRSMVFRFAVEQGPTINEAAVPKIEIVRDARGMCARRARRGTLFGLPLLMTYTEERDGARSLR